MTCQDVAFARGACRIGITCRPPMDGDSPSFVARMWVVDDAGVARPLVLDSGDSAEILGPTEALALSTAMTFLEGQFGA